MKKYVFFTADIQPIGGIQSYVSGKAKYLEATGWKVYVFYAGFNTQQCVFPKLNDYVKGRNVHLAFLPNELTNAQLDRCLRKMKRHIRYTDGDEVFVESNFDVTAIWAELFASRVNGHHACLCCNELFRGGRKHYLDYIKFFRFKYDRNELAGINAASMKNLFAGVYDDVKESEDIVFRAATDDLVQDVHNHVVHSIIKADFNICHIGRAKKGSFRPIVAGVHEFCQQQKSKHIQFIIVGDADADDREWVNNLFSDANNVNITFTGALAPVPKELFSKIDVNVAASGCAIMSASQRVLTILVDANDCHSNGLLGYDTDDFLYRSETAERKTISESLHDTLILKTYLEKEFHDVASLSQSNAYFYDQHFKFFNTNRAYYDSATLVKPKRITIKNQLKLIYFKTVKRVFNQ